MSMPAPLAEVVSDFGEVQGQDKLRLLLEFANDLPALPADIETIGLKCLEKEAARRYPSAEALAEDLGRFAAGRPIAARPVGPGELDERKGEIRGQPHDQARRPRVRQARRWSRRGGQSGPAGSG